MCILAHISPSSGFLNRKFAPVETIVLDYMNLQSKLFVSYIAAVKDLQTSVTNSTSICITWSPADALPGWNISYYYLTYRAKLPDTDKTDTSFRRTVSDGRTSTTLEVGDLLVKEEVRHEFEVVPVLEIRDVEGIGEVKGEKAVLNSTLDYGKEEGNGSTTNIAMLLFPIEKLPFQVAIRPVQYCIHWEVKKSVVSRSQIIADY